MQVIVFSELSESIPKGWRGHFPSVLVHRVQPKEASSGEEALSPWPVLPSEQSSRVHLDCWNHWFSLPYLIFPPPTVWGLFPTSPLQYVPAVLCQRTTGKWFDFSAGNIEMRGSWEWGVIYSSVTWKNFYIPVHSHYNWSQSEPCTSDFRSFPRSVFMDMLVL